jgi:hypothetical protein
MAIINSIKRRKIEQGVASCLSDLPIGILVHAASFLAAPSRALFAVALTTNYDPPRSVNNNSSIAGADDWELTINENNNPPSENYSSIAGADWETLDFGDIEKELAARLTDDDISAVLKHIDAVNKVKRLRITNCTKITGSCLEPLSGSEVIEQIDLSLVGDGGHSMSLELVLPILDSIIELEGGCSLKHLQFPHRWWRRTPNYSSSRLTLDVLAIHAFIGRYNRMRENRGTIRCLHCNQNLPQRRREWIATSGNLYGKNNHTCYQCTKHYCYDCSDEDGIKNLVSCDQCQRDYCKECVEFGTCQGCEKNVCKHCLKFECNSDAWGHECHGKFCSKCVDKCSHCGVSYCRNHNNEIGDYEEDEVIRCDHCYKSYCMECRFDICKEGNDICTDCIKLLHSEAFAIIMEDLFNENRALKLEIEEVEQLKIENRELRDVNKELQAEIKELKDKQGKSMMAE